MTTEQDILSFEKEVEKRNFILDDKLLGQLLDGKYARLRQQFEHNKELRRVTKRR